MRSCFSPSISREPLRNGRYGRRGFLNGTPALCTFCSLLQQCAEGAAHVFLLCSGVCSANPGGALTVSLAFGEGFHEGNRPPLTPAGQGEAGQRKAAVLLEKRKKKGAKKKQKGSEPKVPDCGTSFSLPPLPSLTMCVCVRACVGV